MQRPELVRRSLARTDVRAALTIAGLLLCALILQGTALYVYVATEQIEEAGRWLDHALRAIEQPIRRGEPARAAIERLEASLPGQAIAVRILDRHGESVESWGLWPAEDRLISTPRPGEIGRVRVTRWLDVEHHLRGEAELPDGRKLLLALPLRHFAHETTEIGRRMALVVLISGVAALSIALGASLHAFAPLRRATLLLRGVDASNLGRRLPTRGTGDPVDLHAETLNRVLARIDASFGRLRSFSSDAAHELRTPLNRIGNVVEVALQGGDERELRSALETIGATTQELSQMVQSLLLLAELGDRRLALPWPDVDVDAWIARSVDVFAPSFEEQGVKLAVRSDAGTIEGDRMLLDRILVNLLDNALAQVAPGGRVEVSARRSGDGVTICVDDSGRGVPEEERERIFERFARFEAGRGRVGHGLGLAIARAVAELHGGALDVEDSHLGGARFRLWLPNQRGAVPSPAP